MLRESGRRHYRASERNLDRERGKPNECLFHRHTPLLRVRAVRHDGAGIDPLLVGLEFHAKQLVANA